MLQRTEVTIGDQTWVFTTARIGVDPVTGEEEYETTIAAPCTEVPEPARRCLTQQRARQVHQMFVDEFVATARGCAEINSFP
ncbi:hypothetical protein [Saccharopolyspora endophytica]|uniref:Uncharacterized protein n=1 Tax=Saccharopolyspora endophytica TaxID=543886 RepID=A0ABS5DGX8_9PSEU|nr:hypothetical protein [Saccharopolyspora endophytica]MBQ0925542.1 hypothetical protein [Saccharopolyspora endophytica]